MKKTLIILACLMAGCTEAEHSSPATPVNMANPASVYCADAGGKLEIVEGEHGQAGYCTLPNGERIEEWALYRRDHP